MFYARRPHQPSTTPGKPKGLWRQRQNVQVTRDSLSGPSTSTLDSAARETKRRRLSRSPSPSVSSWSFSSEEEEEEEENSDADEGQDIYLWDYSAFSPSPSTTPPLSPLLVHSSTSTREKRQLNTTSIASLSSSSAKGKGKRSMAGQGQEEINEAFDKQDWLDLKELFARAAEAYDSKSADEALPLLRGVIHECHRCLSLYSDPSLLFATHSTGVASTSPRSSTSSARSGGSASSSAPKEHPLRTELDEDEAADLPTSFHSLFGTALFLFGSLISQSTSPQGDSTLLLSGEPPDPTIYWLASIDVFEMGENLPSRTHGRSLGDMEEKEDWKMAVVWGRTLVALVDERLSSASKTEQAKDKPQQPDPFPLITRLRPPITSRNTLSTASLNELMKMAMDQFSRGIFHMPHSSGTTSTAFSREKELFTIATEVLNVAEKMDLAEERRYWGSWADSVFGQIPSSKQMETLALLRGRCNLIIGSAIAEVLEDGDSLSSEALGSEEAEDARDALSEAIGYFESHLSLRDDDEEAEEVRQLLAEALLTLANLTADETKREAMYGRVEGLGVAVGDGEGVMDVDEE